MPKYRVLYRTGGTENFEWKSTLDEHNLEEAKTVRGFCRKMGYPSVIVDATEFRTLEQVAGLKSLPILTDSWVMRPIE